MMVALKKQDKILILKWLVTLANSSAAIAYFIYGI